MASSLDVPLGLFLSLGQSWRLSLAIAVLSIAYLIGRIVYVAAFSPMKEFPGPWLNSLTKIPRLYNVYTGNEVKYFTRLHAIYGPIVRVGPTELSCAKGAQAWKDIYGFTKSGVHGIKDQGFYNLPVNGVPSLVVADNATHSRQRKIVSHSFSDRALREQEPLLRKWAAVMKEKLDECAQSGEPTDMVRMYNCTTFDIMGDLTFSEDLQMLHNGQVSPWVASVFNAIKANARLRTIKSFRLGNYIVQNLLYSSPTFHAKALKLWKYTADRVDRRLQRDPEHPDLMTKILEKDGMEGKQLLPGEHHSNASLFMIAGTETTATALSGITYFLLRNPSYLQRLTAEIRSNFTTFSDLTLEALTKQRYLLAVLQEGLRMYPPVPIGLPRVTPPHGATICGRFVPGGTSIACAQYATYHDAALFHLPYEFHPERWLDGDDADARFAGDQLAAVEPFSVGPRNCLGRNLAWLEMRLLLVTVLLFFDLEDASPRKKGEKKEWIEQKVFTLWEKRPLMVRVKAAAGGNV